MSLELTEAELATLEYSQVDLQELLGEALVEVQHHRELQSLDSKNFSLLKHQAECAAMNADFVYTNLTQSNFQSVKELQRELVSKSCELSAAQLDLHCWKQKAAVQQLRLVSVQEDLGHQKVHTEALASECSRRQEECNVAQAQLQAATAQNGQLESELSQSASAIADAKAQHATLQAALQDKEGSLQALHTSLHEAQSKLEALEQSAKEAVQAAQQRHAAVEERARLSEQVAAAARERADMAEQRLAQRAELSQERQQHFADLTQERHIAAAERAAVTEKNLRNEICTLQEALQKAQAARLRDTDAVSRDMHGKVQRTQAELREAQHQAEQAMDTVSALVAHLDVTEASLQGNARQAAAPQAAPAAATNPEADHATRGGKGTAPAADKAAVTVYSRDAKRPAAVAASQQQPRSKLAAGKQPAAVGQVAETSQGDAHSPSNSRPARQRGKAQPYWMGETAPASSPTPKEAQEGPAASHPVLACHESQPQDAEQSQGNGAKAGKAGKAKKATMAKRQTRTSPHKEQQQQQPAKRSRAASKQQQGKQQLQHEAAMEVGAEADAEAAEAVQVAEQPARIFKGGAETRQAGSAEAAQTVGMDQQYSDSAALEVAMVEEGDVAQQHSVARGPSASQPSAQGPSAAAAGAPDAIAGALKRFGLKHPTRPVGVAKIDLASSFTDASSPANALSGITSKPTAAGVPQAGSGKPSDTGKAAQGGKGANKENEGESARLGGSKAYLAVQKVVPQPPAALNSRVVAAAAARAGEQAGAAIPKQPAAPSNKDASQPAVANKRKILKPVNVNYSTGGKHQDILPANMLFGDAFMVPKLRK